MNVIRDVRKIHIGTKLRELVKKNILQRICFVLLLGIAVFVRLFNFVKVMDYQPDQGNDLMVAYRIIFQHHLQLVGPMLSTQNIYIPPTYYYILSLFLWIGKNPVGTTYMFFIINIISCVTIFFIGKKLIDGWYGLCAMFLFTMSVRMIRNAQFMWQPQPMIFFLILSLYILLLAKEKRSILLTFVSVFLYIIALSIYPSPILLALYYFIQSSVIVRKDIGLSRLEQLVSLICIWGGSIFLVYLPVLIFVVAYKRPILSTLQSNFTIIPKLSQIGTIFLANTQSIFYDCCFRVPFWPKYFNLISLIIIVLFLFLVVVFRHMNTTIGKKYQYAIKLVSSPWILIGCIPLVLYRDNIFSHHLWSLIPFILLNLSICLRLSFEKKQHWWFRVIATFLVLIFILGNMWAWYSSNVVHPNNDFAHQYEIYSFIVSDMKKRKITSNQIQYIVYTPKPVYLYDSSTVIYLLESHVGYVVSYTDEGNDVEIPGVENPTYIYLLCDQFPAKADLYKGCTKRFIADYPDMYMVEQTVFQSNDLLDVFKKKASLQ